jgi:hypothetical protein
LAGVQVLPAKPMPRGWLNVSFGSFEQPATWFVAAPTRVMPGPHSAQTLYDV